MTQRGLFRFQMRVVDSSSPRVDNLIMTLTADSRGRIASLELFPPGTSFEPEVDGSRIILKRLVPEQPKRVLGKLVRRNGRLMLEAPGEITGEAIAKAVREERDSRA
jgi:hypothetical protein